MYLVSVAEAEDSNVPSVRVHRRDLRPIAESTDVIGDRLCPVAK